jgi:hypothetical protein
MSKHLPALQTYLEERFNGRFTVDQTTPVLTAVQSEILPSNFERMAVQIINQSGSIIYLCLGPFKSLTSGIQLSPNGGGLFINCHDDLVLTGVEIYAWCPSGAANLSVFSCYRYRGVE